MVSREERVSCSAHGVLKVAHRLDVDAAAGSDGIQLIHAGRKRLDTAHGDRVERARERPDAGRIVPDNGQMGQRAPPGTVSVSGCIACVITQLGDSFVTRAGVPVIERRSQEIRVVLGAGERAWTCQANHAE